MSPGGSRVTSRLPLPPLDASVGAWLVECAQPLLEACIGFEPCLSRRLSAVQHCCIPRSDSVSQASLDLELKLVAGSAVASLGIALPRQEAERPFALVQSGDLGLACVHARMKLVSLVWRVGVKKTRTAAS